MKKNLICLVVFLSFTAILPAQHFRNGGLEGSPTHEMSELPDDWKAIPIDDTICKASSDTWASPDLLSHDLPDPEWWLNGDPHGGKTFVAGVKDGNDERFEHDEGIMQLVTDFTPGMQYTVNFWQCVVRESNQLAHSGAWKLYLDETCVGVSDFSYSDRSSSTNKLDWEERNITFVATKTEHWIKFLPVQKIVSISGDKEYALRMGIDDLMLLPGKALSVSIQTGPLLNSLVVTNADSSEVQLSIFLGQKTVPEKKQTIPVGGSEVDLSALPAGEYKLQFVSATKTFSYTYKVEK